MTMRETPGQLDSPERARPMTRAVLLGLGLVVGIDVLAIHVKYLLPRGPMPEIPTPISGPARRLCPGCRVIALHRPDMVSRTGPHGPPALGLAFSNASIRCIQPNPASSV